MHERSPCIFKSPRLFSMYIYTMIYMNTSTNVFFKEALKPAYLSKPTLIPQWPVL